VLQAEDCKEKRLVHLLPLSPAACVLAAASLSSERLLLLLQLEV
jgi:hypothetical protein